MFEISIKLIIIAYGYQILSAIVLLLTIMIYNKISTQFMDILAKHKLLLKAIMYIGLADILGKDERTWETYKNKYGTWEIKRIKGPKTK